MQLKYIYAGIFIALLATSCEHYSERDCCVDQTYVHRYGVTVKPSDWYERGSNGHVITTHRDGVVAKQTFVDGKLHGEATYTFANLEQIQKEETYFNDELVKSITYHPSGIPEVSIEYTSPEIWTETTWYESGQPRTIEKFERDLLIAGEYYDTANHKDSWVYDGNGERMTRDEYGQFLSRDEFDGGELVRKTMYYQNNTPKEVVQFQGGKVDGERKLYYPGGEPMAIESWSGGNQNGQTIIFQNGEKYSEVPYLGNKKNGIERRYKDGSVITQEITWHDDKMHGPTFTYVGETTLTDWYYNGRYTTRDNYESFDNFKSFE